MLMIKDKMFDRLFEFPYACGDVGVCGECDLYTDDPHKDMSREIAGICKVCAHKRKLATVKVGEADDADKD